MENMMEFEITMECKVRKLVTVICDTEEQARNDPFEYATNELEIDQMDWEIVHIECTEK